METLRDYRQRTGATLEELAARVGISQGQLSRIERTGRASLSTAALIERETGVPASVVAQGLTPNDDEPDPISRKRRAA